MIDIHNHSLYGVDDGSDSIETTEKMLIDARAQGISDIIMSPHFRHGMFRYDIEKIEDHFEKARAVADKVGINIYLGCEYHVDTDMVSNLKNHRVHTEGDTDYVLAEYSHDTSEEFINTSVQDLLMAGYVPVIVHVERYGAFLKNGDFPFIMREAGALIQTNAASISGAEGRASKNYSISLINDGVCDIVASDAHNMKERKNMMGKAYKVVSKKFGKDTADAIFTDNPYDIIREIKNR